MKTILAGLLFSFSLATDAVAETFGERRLRGLYRAFAGSAPPSAAELELGIRRTLGVSRRTAEARWAAWVRGRL